ncbi:hypothetical protein CspeluHIS016_0701820 [Cutaneotrichosporon spelunceum]|uniref:Uncharacterized protein n=1 Tax=Cutaneotrichosporon spelunceum TaxID=1672016 RepID=A0AAD3YEN3_9TREE|nr:hypothetical protein CspeluHIS016_0701820 [Cutaneotrichosporon spelunceum]
MSASSGTTLISPTSSSAVPPVAPSAPGLSAHSAAPTHRKHSRTASQHAVGHGHGRRAHGSHSQTRSGRRSSEGEHGRRALASGLAMHALEGKPNARRKTSEPIVGVNHAPPKANRSDTQLPRLGDSPGSGGIAPLKLGGRAEVEIEVIAGPDHGCDDEWESGEETPAGTSRPRGAEAGAEPHLEPVSENHATTAESPTDLPTPSPLCEPRETQLTKGGFPGIALPPPALLSGTVSRSHSPSRPASVLSLSRPDSHTNLRHAAYTPSTGPASEATTEERESMVMHAPEQAREIHKPSPLHTAHGRRASGSVPKTAPLLRRPPSHASLRSIHSLRAPPHPLNALDSPKQRRTASLHYPPVAPALINRETVAGQGWEGDQGEEPPRASTSHPEPRPARVGSFSSVRSLKDLLNGPPPARATSRRLTAMQAATKVSRLGTTSDPVAYHHSLGFSPTTAETAHLLSRFLPPKREGRPRWAITAREALAAHHALEAGEEIEPGRIGLTDGQYRDAHESLVETLLSLGARKPRRGASRISYQALLGGQDEAGWNPRRQGRGMSPLEMSAARVLAQRPRA